VFTTDEKAFTKMTQQNNQTKVFFDGRCSICATEIAKLKERSSDLRFINIHAFEHLPKSKELLLKQLYVQLPNDGWLVGLDANIYMWRNCGKIMLADFFSLPIVYPIAKKVYAWWANRRFNKLYQKLH